jgi:hypothetical protein
MIAAGRYAEINWRDGGRPVGKASKFNMVRAVDEQDTTRACRQVGMV